MRQLLLIIFTAFYLHAGLYSCAEKECKQ